MLDMDDLNWYGTVWIIGLMNKLLKTTLTHSHYNYVLAITLCHSTENYHTSTINLVGSDPGRLISDAGGEIHLVYSNRSLWKDYSYPSTVCYGPWNFVVKTTYLTKTHNTLETNDFVIINSSSLLKTKSTLNKSTSLWLHGWYWMEEMCFVFCKKWEHFKTSWIT